MMKFLGRFFLAALIAASADAYLSATREAFAQELVLPATGVWNGYNNHLNVVECLSGSNDPLDLVLSIRNGNGTAFGSVPFALQPFATRHIILNDFGIANAYGTYTISRPAGQAGGDVRLSCQTVSYRMAPAAATKTIEYGFANLVENPNLGTTAGIFNSFDPDGGFQPTYNWLTVYNPGAAPFSAVVWLYKQDGVVDYSKSFRIEALAPGGRRDYALGHPDGQVVGIYTIVPDDVSAPYGAYLMRYGPNAGGFRFAFSLASLGGSCDSGPVPVSTMDPAINWGEIANPTSQGILTDIEVRNAIGTPVLSQSVFLPPYSQHHIYLNQLIGSRAVGSLSARCAGGSGPGSKLLVQSAFYGHRGGAAGEILPGVEWSYVSQARGAIAGEGDLTVGAVNTFLNAANWNKNFDASSEFSYLDFGIDDSSGTPIRRALKPLFTGSSIDLGLHADTGYNFTGVSRAANRSYDSAYGSETLRVFPDSRGGIGYIINIPARVFPSTAFERGAVQVGRSGHYYEFRKEKSLLIGDSLTQGWMELGGHFDQIAYLDALAARGINATLLWSFIGIDDQTADDRIGYDAPRIWPWIENTNQPRPPYQFSFVDSTGKAQFNENYFYRLREFVNAANQRNIAVVITVHDGWTKTRFGGHPFNAGNGGPLGSRYQYVDLADYNSELGDTFNPGWSYAAKNQFYQERFCDRLIRAVGDLPNVQFEMFNEGEWYDQAKLRAFELHYLDFFKARTSASLLVNDDGVGGEDFRQVPTVDAISLHDPDWSSSTSAKTAFDHYAERFTSENPQAKPIFFSEPVPEYKGEPSLHDGATRLMWGTLVGGGNFVLQNDTSWKFNPAFPDPMIDRLGHAARFFKLIGDRLEQMTPHGELASTGICLAEPGQIYVVYSQSSTSFTLNLSGVSGQFLVRFFDPRNGYFDGSAASISGGASRTITKPSSTDWAVLVEKTS